MSGRYAAPRDVTVTVSPGEHYVTRDPDEMIATVLGSCIAACIRDPVACVGGLNHFMLPESASGAWGDVASASLRYGNFAMERLINDLLCRGARRERLEVKVFGGASMVGGAVIGALNADFVEAYLRDEGLPIAAAHLRGDHARRVHYFPLTGRVMMRELRLAAAVIADREAGYRTRLREQPAGGSIELFD